MSGTRRAVGVHARSPHHDFDRRDVAVIQRKVIKVGKRSAISHVFHVKGDREAITACKVELSMILKTFKVRLIASLFTSLTIFSRPNL